jgi:ribosomal protein S18 acetylase RimI-like enzyme
MFKQEWEQFKKGIFAEEETVTELFNKPYDTTPKDDDNFPDDWHYEFSTDDGSKYIISVFDPYDYPMIAFAQLKDGEYVDDTTNTGDAFRILATVGEVIKKFVTDMEPDQFSFAGVVDDPSRLKLYDRIAQYIKQVSPDYKNVSINNNARFTGGKTGKEYIFHRSTYKQNPDMDEDYDPNGPPPGPEFKPTMPAGTVRVDVSDVYDWYKLGQHISNMKGLGKHDFGQGPPSTILSFGDEDTEHKYIQDLEKTGLTTTDIDPVDPNQPKGMKRQKTDPTFNVNETDDRKAAVLKIQKHLNKKYGANLDLDGKLGPLTLKSINKFMPRAKTGLADEPNKTTAVQGKKLKEADKTLGITFTQEPYEGWNGMGAMITAYSDGDQVGQVIFEPTDSDKNKWYATEVEVEDEFQRRGIATTMYDMAKKIAQKANAVIVPSHAQTSDAKGLWKNKKVWEASGYIPSAKPYEPERYKNVRLPYIDEAESDVSKASVVQFKTLPGPGKPRHSFRVVYDGKVIAYGEVEKDSVHDDEHGASVQEIVVHNKYRRMGIASKIYSAIERKFGYKLHPSDDVRPDGQEFWKARSNIDEASGYIPSAKEKNDPRFKTALTVDVKPDAIKKNAKAFGFKTSRAGIPPQARADGKIAEDLMREFKTFLGEQQEEMFPGYDEQHREKRLGNWLAKSWGVQNGKPQTFYHATTKDFDTFNTSGTGFASALGMAYEVERHGSFFAVDPKFAESFIEDPNTGRVKEGGRILPVHLSIQSPIDLRDDALSRMLSDEETADEFKANGIDLRSVYNHFYELERWELFDGPEGAEFIDNLQKLGFDGAIINEAIPNDSNAKSGQVWVAFNPSQVKSVHNRGSFSPDDPRLTKESG